MIWGVHEFRSLEGLQGGRRGAEYLCQIGQSDHMRPLGIFSKFLEVCNFIHMGGQPWLHQFLATIRHSLTQVLCRRHAHVYKNTKHREGHHLMVAYYSLQKQFERFREGVGIFLADTNSNFVVAKIIFEGFEFLVCSCECAVASLCPRNSISNVVASVTIHDDMYKYMYIYVRDV